MNAAKLAYKPFGLVGGVLAGMVAGRVFKQLWKLAAHEEEAPQATERERGWVEVLAAAAVEATIFALVKAAVERAGAEQFERMTGEWPGD